MGHYFETHACAGVATASTVPLLQVELRSTPEYVLLPSAMSMMVIGAVPVFETVIKVGELVVPYFSAPMQRCCW